MVMRYCVDGYVGRRLVSSNHRVVLYLYYMIYIDFII